MNYSDIIEILEKHLCPRPNAIIEQHRFLSRMQGESEKISDFVAALHGYIANCDFNCVCRKSVAQLFLRAQFLRGLRDSSIREQLLMTSDLTFEIAVQKALAMEASKLNNQEISGNRSQPVKTESINRISRTKGQYQSRGNLQNQPGQKGKNLSNRRRSKSRINFKELGIENMCLRCARSNHFSDQCRINVNKLKCKSCSRIGHVDKVCITTLIKQKSKGNLKQEHRELTDVDAVDYFSSVNRVVDIHSKFSNTSEDSDKYYTDVKIGDCIVNFEVDSGSGFTLLPNSQFEGLKLSNKMESTGIKFRSYSKDVIIPCGVAIVPVKYKEKESTETLFVVPDKFSPVLGRTWIRHLQIELSDIDKKKKGTKFQINSIDYSTTINNITRKYKEIFQPKVGKIPNVKCSLKLRPKAKPMFIKAREIPFALCDKVDKELDDLEQEGIIAKVGTSDWGSPLVTIPKPDGKVRLCVDYRIAVNSQLEGAHYPIPKIDDILSSLRNSKYFCILDLYKAYLHVAVDDDSKVLQTISTHRGTYQMNRLSFGIKTAPSEFHRILDQILNGLKGVTKYFDDIIIHGTTMEECRANLIECLERLSQFDLHVNRSKCQFFKEKVTYLGYVIEHNKISKDPKKVAAILHAPRPNNTEDVKRFLGLVTYYSKFIPNVSTVTFPLRLLLKKNVKFCWSAACESAYNQLKKDIASDRILVPFDPALPISVACDASPTGVAGILSHIVNGAEKPIAFASRSLTQAECNYSQLDREALAIKFAIERFHTYLYGKEFILITDNRPLTRIFHHDAKLPAMTSARLLRYATFLRDFNYKIQHRKSEFNKNVDYLSRAPIPLRNPNISKEEDVIHYETINHISNATVTSKTIAEETRKDPVLKQLYEDLISGQNVDPIYTLQDGVIFRGHRVCIPEKLKPSILAELHYTHTGIVKMKNLARRYCYWKNIDRDIEQIVKECLECAELKKNPKPISTHQWEEPSENYQRIHIDYAGPFMDHNFLIVIDAKSKWPEVKITRNAPTSTVTINMLREIFCLHGLPEVLVSDNASIFTGEEFQAFLKDNGIVHKTIAPGHPATNGQVERYVQIIKRKLKAMENEKTTLGRKIQDILFRYRATPLNCGKTPSELYLKRQIRTKLDLLHPRKVRCSGNDNTTSIRRILDIGERIQSRSYSKNKITWKFGIVKEKLGKLHYIVELDEGYSIRRHIDQLRKCEVEKKTVRFAEKPEVGSIPERTDPLPMEIILDNQDILGDQKKIQEVRVNRQVPEQHGVRRSGRIRKPPEYLSDYVVG